MKRKTKALREKRSTLHGEIKAILDKAEAEKRGLTEDELTDIEKKKEERTDLTRQIDAIESIEDEDGDVEVVEVPGTGGEEEEKNKLRKRYSIVRAMSLYGRGGEEKLDGVEKEMHEEAVKEARDCGVAIEHLGVPVIMRAQAQSRADEYIRELQKRDLTVASATSMGNLVQTSVDPLVLSFMPNLLSERLGATVLSNLKGNLDIPVETGKAVAVWEGETDDSAETTPTTAKRTLSPKRLSAFVDFSKQLLLQSENESVDNYVNQSMERATRIAVDFAAIRGDGTLNSPTGVFYTDGINFVATGAGVTWQNILDLEGKIAMDDHEEPTMAYVTTPSLRSKLKGTLKDSGVSGHIWETDNTMNGFRAFATTQMPSDLGGANLDSGLLFGDWRELVIGQWGGLDILVDPFTNATKALIRTHVNTFWDMVVKRPEAFARFDDAVDAPVT